jgi:hypothetical protein
MTDEQIKNLITTNNQLVIDALSKQLNDFQENQNKPSFFSEAILKNYLTTILGLIAGCILFAKGFRTGDNELIFTGLSVAGLGIFSKQTNQE